MMNLGFPFHLQLLMKIYLSILAQKHLVMERIFSMMLTVGAMIS